MKKRFCLSFLFLLLILAAGSAHYYQGRFSRRHKSFTSAGDCIVGVHLRPHKTATPNLNHLIFPAQFAILSLTPYNFPVIFLPGGHNDIIRPPPVG